jgi:uncharacterized protein
MTAEPTAAEGDEQLLAVEPGYKHVLRLRMIPLWLPLLIGAAILDEAVLSDTVFHRLLPLAVLVLAVVIIIFAPKRMYARLGYRLTDTLLQVARGWLIRVDTMVPFVRVQHIDVTRGPLDNLFGTATLVVHTAGTHNSVVTLPGLSPERAAEIRDIIREHVRTDFG